jgi:hypothetical protein
VITAPNGTTSTLTGAFTVEQGGAPDVWVDLLGLPQIRGGRAQNYFLLVGNRGAVNAELSRVWVSFPAYMQGVSFSPDYLPSSFGQANGNAYLSFDLIPTTGLPITIPLQLTAPDTSGYAHTSFQLQAWKEQ